MFLKNKTKRCYRGSKVVPTVEKETVNDDGLKVINKVPVDYDELQSSLAPCDVGVTELIQSGVLKSENTIVLSSESIESQYEQAEVMQQEIANKTFSQIEEIENRSKQQQEQQQQQQIQAEKPF